MKVREAKLSELHPAEWNPRRISEFQLRALKASLEAHGAVEPIVARLSDGLILGGHQRYEAALELGWKTFPTTFVEVDDDQARRLNVALNRISGEWDDLLLAQLVAEVTAEPAELLDMGMSEEEVADLLASIAEPIGPGGEPGSSLPAPSLADRFVVPPFSILDTRQGYWLERRRQWLSLGIRSEEGRGENLLGMSDAVRQGYDTSMGAYRPGSGQSAYGAGGGGGDSRGRQEGTVIPRGDGGWTGTSVFDPVLCEVAYRWFCPPGGKVLDPFAGGSVRGLVAGRLGRSYVGIELQEHQVKANREQLREIGAEVKPKWIAGEAAEQLGKLKAEPFDMLLSCPPYADLERYSDDPRDLSTMGWPEFRAAYRAIIAAAAERLAEDRFAVWVVGEVRQKGKGSGAYLGLVPETIEAFGEAGLSFYNEAILITPGGSLGLRAGKIFKAGRKLGKCHQNVLVFLKGSAAKATEACGPIELADVAWPEEPSEQVVEAAEGV